MECQNSIAVYTAFVSKLYRDIADCYGLTSRVTAVELRVIEDRHRAEGISFLTKTLPKLGKAFDKALGTDTRFLVQGFSKIPGTVLPRFLGWLLKRVFHDDGSVREDACPQAVKHYRQFVYSVYKLEIPYDETAKNAVIERFKETEEDIRAIPDSAFCTPVVEVAAALVQRITSQLNPMDIIPGHGPGAVATGEKGPGKGNFARIYSSIEAVFPFTEFFVMGMSQLADQADWVQSLEVLESGTAKVVLVPKDSRGPRLISCEPLELMWIQKGLGEMLRKHLERHRLTRGHVNFTDQGVNRALALSGSTSGKWVTLDMKDASDRVGLRLVKKLFSGTRLLDAMIACRSTATRLPSGEVMALEKFAPMGSDLCFPVEALSFWALIVGSLRVGKGYSLYEAVSRVYVYGDDIIVPVEDYDVVLRHLPLVGLMFNQDKCCTAGSFRESCGCDAFKGVDVTPVKLKTVWSSNRTGSASELASWVAYSNHLYSRGYWGAAEFIEQLVEDRYGPIPVSDCPFIKDDSDRSIPSLPGIVCFMRHHVCTRTVNTTKGIRTRYNRALHLQEYRGFKIKPMEKSMKFDPWREMLRRWNRRSLRTEPGTYSPPRRSYLHRGWSSLN